MPKPSTIAQAMHYIKSKWRQGKTLKEVADLHRVDSGNLERAFRKREGMTAKHYVDQLRKRYVRSRLRNKTILGYEIGRDLGFRDDLAFYRWVKRAFGVSFVKLRSQLHHKLVTRKRNKK